MFLFHLACCHAFPCRTEKPKTLNLEHMDMLGEKNAR